MKIKVYSVEQINRYVRNLLENDFVLNGFWVKGEISNFKARNSLMKTGIMMFDVDFNIPAPKNLGLSAEETTITILRI